MAVAELRQKRVENDIETLRSTQSGLMDRFESFAETLNETRDIALDNQSRLIRIEGRMDAFDSRMDGFDTRMDAFNNRLDGFDSRMDGFERRMDAFNNRLDRVEQICAENRALILENREILLAIADHLGLVYEVPPKRPQSD